MGLDISAYSNVKRLEVDHLCEEVVDNAYKDGNVYLWMNDSFPEQSMGFETGIYSVEGSMGFRAGSYGGYNYFRRLLALAGGHQDTLYWDQQMPDVTWPFYWMVNFSDCEGVINAAHSARLAGEFKMYRDEFASVVQTYAPEDSEYYLNKYDEWQRAYELASDNGVVHFH